MRMKFLLLAGTVLLSAKTGFAQSAQLKSCLTEKMVQEMEAQFPTAKANRLAMEQQIQAYISQQKNLKQVSGVVVKIPVVIHVVTESGCNGISKAQILNGLEVLNKDFRRQNADTANTRAIFKPYAADTEIEFVLARKDPNGMATEGINRVTSPTANGPINRDDVKVAAPAWPTDKYFNIWLVENIYDAQVGANVLGYAYFPSILASAPNKFGVVLVHTVWGKQGAVPGSTATTNGRNATHEIAHCLNLLHIESSTCIDADLVSDTPPSIFTGPIPGTCDFNQNTCSNDPAVSLYTTNVPDQIENYLSYSGFDCMNVFTIGQKNRMQAAFMFYTPLQNLVSPGNAVFTGIDPNTPVGSLLATPYFCVNSQRVCEGSSVTFSDKSYGPAATSWNWSFPGGTPATSTLQNPVVTYSTPGNYDVSLIVGSTSGTANNTWTNHIKVVPTSNLINISPPGYFLEEFNESTFPISVTPNRSWEMNTTATGSTTPNWRKVNSAYSNAHGTGTNSLKLENANIPAGTVSTLITPNFSLQGGFPSFVGVEIAYAKRLPQSTESLKVFYSHDCGATWVGPVKSLIGNQLITNGGAQVTNFVPTATEWRMETISQGGNQMFNNASHIMFKIETTSNGGGNLYLDNFIIGSVLGTKESLTTQNIQLFPNPLTAETGILFELKTPETGQVKIFDVLGNEVYAGKESTFSVGKHTVSLTDKKLSSGVYMVQLELGGKLFNTKLLVQ